MIPPIVPLHQKHFKDKFTYNDKTATQNRYKQTGGRRGECFQSATHGK
jgi:hypothetical protein